MAQPLQLPLRERPHRNHGLFSDHYLDVALPAREDWRALAAEARAAMDAVADVFATASPHPDEKEAETERTVVRPVLEQLGHTFAVQPTLQTPGGGHAPDYVLYRDGAAADEMRGRTLTEELLAPRALAICDAKHWDRPLDVALKARGGNPFTNANPSFQISFYLQHSGVAWGVLTNGRLWRLYHAASAHKLDRCYEVDLGALATGGDIERFLYFYAFFRRAAFDVHPMGLAALLGASTEYARGVGASLEAQVYEALRHLAQGFLDFPDNRLASDDETLGEIYDASLIVLYRLLFVLYAEARGLLPAQEAGAYRDEYGLVAIKQNVARRLDRGSLLLPGAATVWPLLRQLFRIVDAGDPDLGVSTYNGGLFDPERHRFLERHTVGDAHLQQAIDNLTRVGPPGRREWVDYRDLAERHLGTIYEGLLEYRLRATPPRDGWTVELLNEGGERKATGSYYTPDDIVKYMVDRALGPALRRAVAGEEADEAKVDAVLALNVLDPAMGSGHFLVEATEYIARFLVGLNVAPAGLGAGGEAELAYWKRRVVQSCIYGVDLNPLAVELAKLSLWLGTVARDRPLSFLDHHLRTGNSLVGARVAELRDGALPRRGRQGARGKGRGDAVQLTMLDDEAFRRTMMTAVDSMWMIEASPARTVEDVKAQERAYAELRRELTERHARLADLVTALRLGLEIEPGLLQPLADLAVGRATFRAPQLEAPLAESAAVLPLGARVPRGVL